VAEHYPPGKVRIFYQATGFKAGLQVTANLLLPGSCWACGIILLDVEEGIYYFDYNFSVEGDYLGVFYENGEKRTTRHFNIKQNNGGVVIKRIPHGDQLINL
jgi:hypothetical protein